MLSWQQCVYRRWDMWTWVINCTDMTETETDRQREMASSRPSLMIEALLTVFSDCCDIWHVTETCAAYQKGFLWNSWRNKAETRVHRYDEVIFCAVNSRVKINCKQSKSLLTLASPAMGHCGMCPLYLQQFFQCTVSSCLHHLLPQQRDNVVTSRLRSAFKFPVPFARTNKF